VPGRILAAGLGVLGMAAACNQHVDFGGDETDTGFVPDTGQDTDTGSDTDTGADTDTDTGVDTDTDTDTDPVDLTWSDAVDLLPLPTGGAPGARTLTVEAYDNTAVLGAQGGAFWSVDGGLSWSRIRDPVLDRREGREVGTVALVDDLEAFLATSDGVFRTVDGGVTFVDVTRGLAERQVVDVHTDGTVVYAVDSGWSGGDTLYRWDPGDSSWDGVSGTVGVDRVALGAGKLWTLDADRNLVRVSNDDGRSWTSLPAFDGFMSELAVNDFGTVIVGRTGAARSEGGAWTPLPALAGERITDIACDGALWYVSTSTGGVYRSIDNGVTFVPSSTGVPPGPGQRAHGVALGDDEVLYGSLGDGAYRSIDGGDTWIVSHEGLTGLTHTDLHVEGEVALTAVLQARLWRLSEEGEWDPLDNGIPFDARVASGTVVGRSWLAGSLAHGVWRSDDRGVTWSASSAGLPEYTGLGGQQVYEVEHLERTPSGEAWVGFGAGTMTDGGETMTVGGGVAVSTDGGATWVRHNDGLPYSGLDLYGDFTWSPVTLLRTFDPVRLVHLDRDGLYRAEAVGDRWTWAGTGLPEAADDAQHAPVLDIARDRSTGRLWAALGVTHDGTGAVAASDDDGVTWTVLSEGLPAGIDVQGIEVIQGEVLISLDRPGAGIWRLVPTDRFFPLWRDLTDQYTLVGPLQHTPESDAVWSLTADHGVLRFEPVYD